MKHFFITIGLLSLVTFGAFGNWPNDEIRDYDRLLLSKTGIKLSTESLGGWLKTRVVGKIPQESIGKLVKQLGDEQFENREKAARELQSLGFESVRELHKATKNPDPEISDRAKKCLSVISPNESSALKAAVIRNLARVSPQDFLNILPSLDNNHEDVVVLESILDALLSIPNGVRGMEITATQLLKSKNLKDQILGAWVSANLTTTSTLFPNNTPAIVQLNYGYALLRERKPEGITWIIQALPNLKPPQAFQAANHLAQLASLEPVLAKLRTKDRNVATIGNDLKTWWLGVKNNYVIPKNNDISLYPQRILASIMDLNANQGKLLEVCWDGSTKPLFAAPFYINQAIALDHVTILIGDQGRSLATWTIGGDLLVRSDPRPNFTSMTLDEKGNRYLYSSPEIQELDRTNKAIKSSPVPLETATVVRLKNGDFISITKKGELCLLEGKSPVNILLKMENTVKFSANSTIEPTPKGTFLLSAPTSREIREYSPNGKLIGVFPLPVNGKSSLSFYHSFFKLPNGNLLVGNRNNVNLSEVDTIGNEIKAIPLEGRPRKLFSMPVRMVLPD